MEDAYAVTRKTRGGELVTYRVTAVPTTREELLAHAGRDKQPDIKLQARQLLLDGIEEHHPLIKTVDGKDSVHGSRDADHIMLAVVLGERAKDLGFVEFLNANLMQRRRALRMAMIFYKIGRSQRMTEVDRIAAQHAE